MKHDIPQDLIDQKGFTLIELMISLVLGLLISAAVIQVFLTSQRVDRIQKAGSEIQDKAVFGIQGIEEQVRLANLGNDGVPTNDTTAQGGIVLTAGDSGDSGGGSNEGEGEEEEGNDDNSAENQCDVSTALDSESREKRKAALNAAKTCLNGMKNIIDSVSKKGFDNLKNELKPSLNDRQKELLEKEIKKIKDELEGLKIELDALKKELDGLKGEIKEGSIDKLNEINRKVNDIAKREIEINKKQDEIRKNYGNNNKTQSANYLEYGDYSAIRPAVFLQRAYFKKASFQKISSSKPSLFNVVVKGGLASGYLTRSGSMSSNGGKNKWNGDLSNTNTPSDQLTIQYTNTTGQAKYDCEGGEIKPNERVIMRYFVVEDEIKTNKARKNLNLNCDAGRIKEVDGKLAIVDFGEDQAGQTIIQNIDQFNIRLGIQRSVVNDGNLSYEYADMTVSEYMSLQGTKPYITNIRIAILARSTSNSPEASNDEFLIFNEEQELEDQKDAPKYIRRVYQTNILLRNARLMPIVDNITI